VTRTSEQGKKLPNSLVHAGHKSGPEGREETAFMMRTFLHRGVKCNYASNKNVINQSEVSNLRRLQINLQLSQVAYFWLVDDVLVAHVVAFCSSMEKGPQSDDTTLTTWSRSRSLQRKSCKFWAACFVIPIGISERCSAGFFSIYKAVLSLHLNEASYNYSPSSARRQTKTLCFIVPSVIHGKQLFKNFCYILFK